MFSLVIALFTSWTAEILTEPLMGFSNVPLSEVILLEVQHFEPPTVTSQCCREWWRGSIGQLKAAQVELRNVRTVSGRYDPWLLVLAIGVPQKSFFRRLASGAEWFVTSAFSVMAPSSSKTSFIGAGEQIVVQQ